MFCSKEHQILCTRLVSFPRSFWPTCLTQKGGQLIEFSRAFWATKAAPCVHFGFVLLLFRFGLSALPQHRRDIFIGCCTLQFYDNTFVLSIARVWTPSFSHPFCHFVTPLFSHNWLCMLSPSGMCLPFWLRAVISDALCHLLICWLIFLPFM